MHFCYILERREVAKSMLSCELRKVFSKKINQIVLGAVLIFTIVWSCFAIGSGRYVDKKGNTHTGITAYRSLDAD